MKININILTLAVILLISCKKGNDLESKKAHLTELKKQYAQLETQINKLEEEIALIPGSKTPEKITNVGIEIIKNKPFKHFIEVQGKVESDKNVLINPELNGTYEKVLVKTGDRVSKGQLLAQLDASMILHSIEEVKSQKNFAQTMYNKQKRLWDQKIGTEVQYLTAKNNLTSLEKKLATLQKQYEMTRITAPISGTMDEVNAKEGEIASPMMAAFRVVNLSDFKVVAELAEAFVAKVKKGDKVEVNFPDIHKTVNAKVTDKSEVIDPVNRTFNVEIALKDDKGGFRPNMVSKVKINDYLQAKALVIPINTVQAGEQGDFVFVAVKEGGKYVVKKQPVVQGISYADQVEIKDGLKAGDNLIVTGYQDIAEGTVVKF